jgi:hypothetical protein
MNVLLLAALLTAAIPFEAQTLDGKRIDGDLTELTANRVSLQTAQGPVAIDLENLIALSPKQRRSAATNPNEVLVQLADGSCIHAKQFTCKESRVQVTLLNGQSLEMPVRDVLAVRLPFESESAAAEWTRLLGMKHNADVLVLHKNEILDYHEGVLHDVTEEMVHFEIEGERLPVSRAKVYGLMYQHRTEDALPTPYCRITETCGSQWSVRKLTFSNTLELTTPGELHVSLPLEDVARIDFAEGKIAYLSDMKPDNLRWTPFFSANKATQLVEKFYEPRRDRSFDLTPLQLGGVSYDKGLAIHTRTELSYRLPNGFRQFRAIAGIDDAMRPNGKVRLIIRGDANILLDTVISGNNEPLPIDLDLSGVRRLTILVDFADTVDVGDHLLLCNARITK